MLLNFYKILICTVLFQYSLIVYAHEKKYILGVTVGNITKSQMDELELKDKSGAIILKLYDFSAAKMGGLLVGDIIVKIDNRTINNFYDLTNYLANYEGNGIIYITTLRNKKIFNIPIKLIEK